MIRIFWAGLNLGCFAFAMVWRITCSILVSRKTIFCMIVINFALWIYFLERSWCDQIGSDFFHVPEGRKSIDLISRADSIDNNMGVDVAFDQILNSALNTCMCFNPTNKNITEYVCFSWSTMVVGQTLADVFPWNRSPPAWTSRIGFYQKAQIHGQLRALE